MVLIEQRDLRAKSWIALYCVSNSVMFVYDKIVGKYSIDLELLGEAITPSLDLLVILMAPVEARSGGFSAGVKTDFSVYYNLA